MGRPARRTEQYWPFPGLDPQAPPGCQLILAAQDRLSAGEQHVFGDAVTIEAPVADILRPLAVALTAGLSFRLHLGILNVSLHLNMNRAVVDVTDYGAGPASREGD